MKTLLDWSQLFKMYDNKFIEDKLIYVIIYFKLLTLSYAIFQVNVLVDINFTLYELLKFFFF